MRCIPLILVLALPIGGCVDVPRPRLQEQEEVRLSQAMAPSRDEARRVLGEPEAVVHDAQGHEVWVYDFDRRPSGEVDFITYALVSPNGDPRAKKRLAAFFIPSDLISESFQRHAVRSPIALATIRLLHDGMSANAAVELLGKSHLVKTVGQEERWVYDFYNDNFTGRIHLELAFRNGALVYYPLIPTSFVSETIRVSPRSAPPIIQLTTTPAQQAAEPAPGAAPTPVPPEPPQPWVPAQL